ncbi:helix-turn-helix transcriptional regulator [Hazenella sp. IB182357]|uniref:Helix-turn-helix transcriptional regulator n=1 Tax=Polycladospora coralii TaxID=2771432 RepID=A0A926NBL3_9BACL|nr:metalloregulator ArsR/SmtB family transcription factor [Polycladospora coralii]MBD1373242.1 helix-turn-helix transcriptional regulator [Polycladospora coralii]MBS7530900.1 helix-turn-helix transcriptional regulator [Polycladospora coralii]
MKAQNDQCEVSIINPKKISNAKKTLANEDFIGTSQLFKALSDPTRLKIAFALIEEQELCVCDVAEIIESSIATTSHHLRLLRKLGLAKYRKIGKQVFYSLDDDHVKQLVEIAFIHHKEAHQHVSN